jgi:hypothetical protein
LLGDVFLRVRDSLFSPYCAHIVNACVVQNVYVSHQLETPHSPPQIGLIGTTDADKAMASFLTLRGYDSTPTGITLANHVSTSQKPTSGVIYGASVVAGFVAGTIFMLIFLFRRAKYGTK